jgi:hypothetical protein
LVLVERWRAKNTYLHGRQLQFIGTGWGIFGLWVYPRLMQWKVEKTVFA